MRIDVHADYWTDDYLDRLVELGKTDTDVQRGTGAGGGAELDARLRLMEQAGVEMQVLSASPQLPYGEDPDKTMKLARFVNDQYAELVDQQRDHFRAFAALPLPHIDASIKEMGRALDELGMVGVVMNTTVLGRALVQPDFEPIFRGAQRARYDPVPAPSGQQRLLTPDRRLPPDLDGRSAGRGHHFHHAANHSGYPTRYPNITIINSHLGGALPMLLQRADDQYRWEAPGTPEPPSVASRRMWYDTVGHGHVPALKCAIESFGAERLVLGTDFPYESGDTFVRAVEYINDPHVDACAARAILDQNAGALLGMG